MKKIILGLVLLSLFLVGCEGIQQAGKGSNELLNIELYDAQGNLVTSSLMTAGSIVSGIQDVKFVRVNVGTENEGNVKLRLEMAMIMPPAIIDGIKKNLVPTQWVCKLGSISCALIPDLRTGERIVLGSGLIDINEVGIGTHKLVAKVIALYEDEEGKQQSITASKTALLEIKPDPIRAGISVDIGTSSSNPPPPCRLECPPDYVLKGNCCVPLSPPKCLPGQKCVMPCVEPREICMKPCGSIVGC